MKTINKVILIANLTRDPKLTETPSGQKVCTFGVATNREWTTSTGDKKSSAEFIEVVAWSKLGEICSNYLKKGKLVYIEGYLKTRVFDNEDGTRSYRTEVVANDMSILSSKSPHGSMGDDDYGDDDHGDDDHHGDEDHGNSGAGEVSEESSDNMF